MDDPVFVPGETHHGQIRHVAEPVPPVIRDAGLLKDGPSREGVPAVHRPPGFEDVTPHELRKAHRAAGDERHGDGRRHPAEHLAHAAGKRAVIGLDRLGGHPLGHLAELMTPTAAGLERNSPHGRYRARHPAPDAVRPVDEKRQGTLLLGKEARLLLGAVPKGQGRAERGRIGEEDGVPDVPRQDHRRRRCKAIVVHAHAERAIGRERPLGDDPHRAQGRVVAENPMAHPRELVAHIRREPSGLQGRHPVERPRPPVTALPGDGVGHVSLPVQLAPQRLLV